MLGPIGVGQRSGRTSSRGFYAAWAVLSAVLMVLTCCSMKPLDLGKWESALCGGAGDKNGWLLSIESRDSGLY